MDNELVQALAAGPGALRALGRAWAGQSDTDALERAARVLPDLAPPGLTRPFTAAFLAWGKQPQAAIELYESWLVDAEAPEAWHLTQLCRAYRKVGDAAGVFRTAARFHPWDLDADARQQALPALVWAREQGVPEALRTRRVALLGTFTTHTLLAPLRIGALRLGLDLDVWEADFDQLRAQILDPGSALYAHQPEVVILATTWRDVQRRPVVEQVAEWELMWNALLERTGAQVLQHTFDRPPYDPDGHLQARDPGSIRRLAADLNAALADRAPPRVSLVDYEQAVFRSGAETWADNRQWHWAKEAVRPAVAPWLVEEYLAVLRAWSGQTKKVLVLDLDNTMWGGIVGEVGVEGLAVGPPSVEGEAHQALQRYAKGLAARGILLAVCSKNNLDDARAPFEQLPDMILQFGDFVSFDASWGPKPQRVRQMAKMLNLGLDSFVFVDDNPAERAFMRREAPEVLTIPLPDDPAGYVQAVDRARAFEVLAVSTEDRARTELYKVERAREDVRMAAPDAESYYRSLEMVASIAPFLPADQARVVQLAARSNQFNLTTWRLSAQEVAALAESPAHECRTFRIRDRFGDYGLVLVLVTEVTGDELDVKAFFMSCRVIARSVEQLALAELDAIAIARGCRFIRGRYLPTKKNRELVSDLYRKLGFELLVTHPDGATEWQRRVDPAHPAVNPFIGVERRTS